MAVATLDREYQMPFVSEAALRKARASSMPGSTPDDYWNALIDEAAAAAFLDLTARTLQKWRQVGGGPRYVQISARCLRYRRADLRLWAEERIRASTSDRGAGGRNHGPR
jgi:hypothetical protein